MRETKIGEILTTHAGNVAVSLDGIKRDVVTPASTTVNLGEYAVAKS